MRWKNWNTSPTWRRRSRASRVLLELLGPHAGERDGALVGPVEPGDQVQQRRLAAARRPHQSDELTGPHGEIDPAQRAHRGRTVGLAQTPDDEVRHTGVGRRRIEHGCSVGRALPALVEALRDPDGSWQGGGGSSYRAYSDPPTTQPGAVWARRARPGPAGDGLGRDTVRNRRPARRAPAGPTAEELVRHRPEQQAAQRALVPDADDDHLGVVLLRGSDQSLGGPVVDDLHHRAHPGPLGGGDGRADDGVLDLLDRLPRLPGLLPHTARRGHPVHEHERYVQAAGEPHRQGQRLLRAGRPVQTEHHTLASHRFTPTLCGPPVAGSPGAGSPVTGSGAIPARSLQYLASRRRQKTMMTTPSRKITDRSPAAARDRTRRCRCTRPPGRDVDDGADQQPDQQDRPITGPTPMSSRFFRLRVSWRR